MSDHSGEEPQGASAFSNMFNATSLNSIFNVSEKKTNIEIAVKKAMAQEASTAVKGVAGLVERISEEMNDVSRSGAARAAQDLKFTIIRARFEAEKMALLARFDTAKFITGKKAAVEAAGSEVAAALWGVNINSLVTTLSQDYRLSVPTVITVSQKKALGAAAAPKVNGLDIYIAMMVTVAAVCGVTLVYKAHTRQQ